MYLKLLKMWLHVVPCYHRGTVWFGGFNQSRKTFIDGLLRWNTLHNTITVMLYSLPICIWISFPKLYSAPSDLSKSAYREETLLLKGPDVKMSSFAHNSIAVCHHRGLSVVLASSYNVTPPPPKKTVRLLQSSPSIIQIIVNPRGEYKSEHLWAWISRTPLKNLLLLSGCTVIKAALPPVPSPHPSPLPAHHHHHHHPHSLAEWRPLINHAEQEKNTC